MNENDIIATIAKKRLCLEKLKDSIAVGYECSRELERMTRRLKQLPTSHNNASRRCVPHAMMASAEQLKVVELVSPALANRSDVMHLQTAPLAATAAVGIDVRAAMAVSEIHPMFRAG